MTEVGVRGIATVILDGVTTELAPGQSIDIGIGQAHRCENHSVTPVEFIEIQTGTHFGEDDIVRPKTTTAVVSADPQIAMNTPAPCDLSTRSCRSRSNVDSEL
jgi:uncharacterized cupin superfamily protein